jgi:thiol:disulfide interchange protein DsbC
MIQRQTPLPFHQAQGAPSQAPLMSIQTLLAHPLSRHRASASPRGAAVVGALCLALLALVPAPAARAQLAAVDAEVEARLRQALGRPEVGLEVESVAASRIPGMYRVKLLQGPQIYVTADGSYFILGDLFAVQADGFVNVAEEQRAETRRLALEAVPQSKMIVFPAEGPTLASVSVFTDVSCPWCQRLHREVPELNERGVEVRYLAYPRAGIGSEGFRQLASAWCADDRQSTLTRLKNREEVPDNVCPGNPIAEQFELGKQLGVTGTPAIILSSGQLIPGYKTAEDLIGMLGVE